MLMSMPLIVNCTHRLTVSCGNISVRGQTLEQTACLKESGSEDSMAVTGDETEAGRFLLPFLTSLSTELIF